MWNLCRDTWHKPTLNASGSTISTHGIKSVSQLPGNISIFYCFRWNLKFSPLFKRKKSLATNERFLLHFFAELIQWSKKCLSAEAHTNAHLNILVCDDETLAKFPIRSAQHLIHYSLPEKVRTFSQRYITCYGFYEDRLCRELLIQEKHLPRSVSQVFFDEHLTAEYIQIFELLMSRTESQPPTHLNETIQVIWGKTDEKYHCIECFFRISFYSSKCVSSSNSAKRDRCAVSS